VTGPTRRTWLVTIGQAAAGASLAEQLPWLSSGYPSLPPGVYLPSRDHLSHALMSSEEFHSLPPGCPTDYVRPQSGHYTPVFFNGHDFAVIRRLIELLVGSEGEEFGELAGIAQWVDLRVGSDAAARNAWLRLNSIQRQIIVAYYGAEEARTLHTRKPEIICNDGLSWLADMTKSRHSKDFLSLSLEEQIEILSSLGDEHRTDRAENAGTRFFDYLKGETIRGFYTSKAGLKELDFKGNAYYAKSPGCNRKKA